MVSTRPNKFLIYFQRNNDNGFAQSQVRLPASHSTLRNAGTYIYVCKGSCNIRQDHVCIESPWHYSHHFLVVVVRVDRVRLRL
jgi:hypothetical protein